MRSPEEEHEGLDEGLKVVVSVDGRLALLVQGDVPEQLRRRGRSRSLLTPPPSHSAPPPPPPCPPLTHILPLIIITTPRQTFFLNASQKHHDDYVLFHTHTPPPPTPPSLRALTHLHSDDGVDEEQHGDEEAHIRQRLRGDTFIVQRSIKTAEKTIKGKGEKGGGGGGRGELISARYTF